MARLWSVFTSDMDTCYFSGSTAVERHHIFGGPFRKKSEIYGFVIPLRPDLHPNGVHYDPRNLYGVTDLKLKQMAQNRLTAKDEESVTYSPEQNAVVKKAVLETYGNYLVMIVSPDVETIAAAFRAELGV